MVPLVSIIIPVYNSENYIAETIENALSQTWRNKEIIVVDDGSADASLSIAKKFASDRVRVYCVSNGGAARARNIGFGYSKGDFIQYLDADDLMKEDKIELQMNRLLNSTTHGQALCAGQWLRFNRDLADIIGGIGPAGPAENDMSPLEWLLLRPYNLMTVHGWLTPRSLIEKAGPWNETMTLDDDGEFFMRVVGQASRVLFCKGALTYYRTVKGSGAISQYSVAEKSQSNCNKLNSAYKSLETFREVLFRLGQSRAKRTLGTNFLYMAYDAYLVCDEVYKKCITQPEVPVVQRFRIYNLKKGKLGLLSLLLGWKMAKNIFMKLGMLS